MKKTCILYLQSLNELVADSKVLKPIVSMKLLSTPVSKFTFKDNTYLALNKNQTTYHQQIQQLPSMGLASIIKLVLVTAAFIEPG